MSKYNALWEYVQNNKSQSFKITFDEIDKIAGVAIDHSFLNYKKELLEYGYEVKKISMKEQTVLFNRIELEDNITDFVSNIIEEHTNERPILDRNLKSDTFRTYYYLKEELIDFCRKNSLPTSGGKLEIIDRIAYFLDTGKIHSVSSLKKKSAVISELHEDTLIETNFVCSEIHRSFFEKHIGKSFSFYVPFQKWLKSHSGLTYKDAIAAYYQILEDKKTGKSKIDKQFEYNTYIRDFFADNQGKSLDEAIQCWKYKKQRQGHNRYEQTDLVAIEK